MACTMKLKTSKQASMQRNKKPGCPSESYSVLSHAKNKALPPKQATIKLEQVNFNFEKHHNGKQYVSNGQSHFNRT